MRRRTLVLALVVLGLFAADALGRESRRRSRTRAAGSPTPTGG